MKKDSQMIIVYAINTFLHACNTHCLVYQQTLLYLKTWHAMFQKAHMTVQTCSITKKQYAEP